MVDLNESPFPSPVTPSLEETPIDSPEEQPLEESIEAKAELVTALKCLDHMLRQDSGCVSSFALRQALEGLGIEDAPAMVVRLRYLDQEGDVWQSLPIDEFRFRHYKRSFYTDAAYQEVENLRRKEAERAESTETGNGRPRVRKRRQEEARLVTYVRSALEEIYSSDDEWDRPVAFDVHNERPGNDFENVDLIAVHWRGAGQVDLVSVEVKLGFSAKLVQQANNYRRFSDRAWIACPISGDPDQAAAQLREQNPRLFDYVIGLGMGILACKRRPGNCYQVAPIQWPRRNRIDPLERMEFVRRHHETFVRAGVVPHPESSGYPRLI